MQEEEHTARLFGTRLMRALAAMDEFLQRVFLQEVVDRCETCFAAVEELNAILKEQDGRRNVFRPAAELICQAALISKLLWPPGNKNKSSRERALRRGVALRKTLGIEGHHPIKDRSLRDHFEHYDERLDAWAEESRHRNIVRRLVGPRSAIGGDAIGDSDIIEHYDPGKKSLAFRGEHFDIQQLVHAIEEIHRRAMRHLDSGHGV